MDICEIVGRELFIFIVFYSYININMYVIYEGFLLIEFEC